jgi:hypothetical protein
VPHLTAALGRLGGGACDDKRTKLRPQPQRSAVSSPHQCRNPAVVQQMVRDGALRDPQHRRDQLGLRFSSKGGGIGSDSIHCRMGACGMALFTKCAAACG